jgi:sugar-specific transcriptional regulator TrmB
MARDVVKVRKVGETLVGTLTQAILGSVDIVEGDRLILEAVPPRRVIATKEAETMSSTQRLELEINAFEAREYALVQQAEFVSKQHNYSMPASSGMEDQYVVDLTMAQLSRDIAQTASEIAQKRLELFDIQGESCTSIIWSR